MITEKDKALLAKKGISEEKFEHQLACFATGFPFLRLAAAASVEKGILTPNAEEEKDFLTSWENYTTNEQNKVVKFVPASGAASRMFKNVFAFVDAEYNEPTTDFEKFFFDNIHKAPYFNDLDAACTRLFDRNIDNLIATNQQKKVAKAMLSAEGLNYGALPKGLLKFHRYPEGSRTPLEEHLVEGALYAREKNNTVNVHFTVSPEHRSLFEALVKEVVPTYEAKFGVKYHVTFSEQKPSTDTVAANPDNTPFRTKDGNLLFRPGGHGALIENLNDIDADVVFIKNIDNVVPDRLKEDTVRYKKLLAGVLVKLQAQAFAYLRKKLNRPMRVCGMVRNVGEPGGGPFLAYNADGTISLQILESSQIDMNDPEKKEMFEKGTHFNPVDLVCAIKDYKGQAFHLPDYVDPQTGFISHKSKDGKELKALELPGLWNGAMSDWNTVFVEVPLSTFNPVKTVNDLYREQHQ